MEYFKLNNGVMIPKVGLGVSQIPSDVDGVAVVVNAIEAGYKAIDTAEFYGNEDMVGKGIKTSGVAREGIFVTTKVHNQAQQTDDGPIKAFEASLKKLDLDYIDLYLIHWPYPGRFVQTYKALESIYKRGLVKAIGISNFKQHHIQELEKHWEVKPAANQYEHHPYLTQKDVREYCQDEDIQVIAYSPLGRGSTDLLTSDIITSLANKYAKTPAQIILRWNIDNGVAAIPKTTNIARLRENINIFDFKLEKADIEAINSLNQGIRVIRDPDDPSSY
ncbi:MAG: aldo/keto reductase [Defluviitaleaceae bacterium]|nr:aldo/keto reductase [Defluviitaleaceae bacterium]